MRIWYGESWYCEPTAITAKRTANHDAETGRAGFVAFAVALLHVRVELLLGAGQFGRRKPKLLHAGVFVEYGPDGPFDVAFFGYGDGRKGV